MLNEKYKTFKTCLYIVAVKKLSKDLYDESYIYLPFKLYLFNRFIN